MSAKRMTQSEGAWTLPTTRERERDIKNIAEMHKQNNNLTIQRITQRQFQEGTIYSVPSRVCTNQDHKQQRNQSMNKIQIQEHYKQITK